MSGIRIEFGRSKILDARFEVEEFDETDDFGGLMHTLMKVVLVQYDLGEH